MQQEESKNGSKEVKDEILKDNLDTVTVAEIDQLKNNNTETTATSEPSQEETQAQK